MQIIFKAVTGSSGHAPWWEGKCGTVRAREKSVAKNHGGSRCLGKFSLLGNVRHLSVPQQIRCPGLILSKATRQASNNRLHRVQCSSFPPEGVTGTSGYRFEYNLHLIKIPSHLNRESIYTRYIINISIHAFLNFDYVYKSGGDIVMDQNSATEVIQLSQVKSTLRLFSLVSYISVKTSDVAGCSVVTSVAVAIG